MQILIDLGKIAVFLFILGAAVIALADGEYVKALIGGVFLTIYSFFAFTEPEYLDSFLPEEEGENHG